MNRQHFEFEKSIRLNVANENAEDRKVLGPFCREKCKGGNSSAGRAVASKTVVQRLVG